MLLHQLAGELEALDEHLKYEVAGLGIQYGCCFIVHSLYFFRRCLGSGIE